MDFDFCEPTFDNNIEIDEDAKNSTQQTSISSFVNSIKKKINKRREIKIDIDDISFVDTSLEENSIKKMESKPSVETNKVNGDDLKQKLENIFNQLNSQEEEDLSQLAFAFSR